MADERPTGSVPPDWRRAAAIATVAKAHLDIGERLARSAGDLRTLGPAARAADLADCDDIIEAAYRVWRRSRTALI